MKISIRYILVAACYGLAGLVMGMAMGITHNFVLMPVHAHLNLLGWFALTLYGLTYGLYPQMGENRLASIQFYIANAGLILMIPSLALLMLGNDTFIPVMAIGEVCTVVALMLFIVNVYKHRNCV